MEPFGGLLRTGLENCARNLHSVDTRLALHLVSDHIRKEPWCRVGLGKPPSVHQEASAAALPHSFPLASTESFSLLTLEAAMVTTPCSRTFLLILTVSSVALCDENSARPPVFRV